MKQIKFSLKFTKHTLVPSVFVNLMQACKRLLVPKMQTIGVHHRAKCLSRVKNIAAAF